MEMLFAISPIVLIFVLMTWAKRSADVAGLIGWLYTALLAGLYFKTGWSVILVASIAGIVASFPISLMVVASIFQINVMEEAGAIRRLVVFMKTLASGDRPIQVMIINVGIGTLLAALGATPVSILPPIMLALGYSAFVAIALPAIGYDALCTYALLGVPVVVFADTVTVLTGQTYTPTQVGFYFAQYMPVITTLIAISMLWLVGGWSEIRRGFLTALMTGLTAGAIAIGMNYAGLPTLTGVAAGIGIVIVMLALLRFKKQSVIDRTKITPAELEVEKRMSLKLAILPWILLIIFSIVTNFKALGIYDFLFTDLAMPLSIVPGGKPIPMRMAWQAYTWVLIATLCPIPFFRMKKHQIDEALRKTLKRVPRPAFTAAIYFAIAYLLNDSGKILTQTDKGHVWAANPDGANMIAVVAQSSAALFGTAYAGVSAFLGLLGGFISGSETSSIVMLTKLHFDTVKAIFEQSGDANTLSICLLVAAVSGIGGGLASVISPAKLQNAAAVIDMIGMEAKVIKSTMIIALLMTCAAAIMTFVFLAFM